MTVHEAAELWGTCESTVRRYCRKGYVQGAYKKTKGWWLPDGYLQPYLPRKRTFSGTGEKYSYVLKALESEKALDFRLLAMEEEEFWDLVRRLQRAGYVDEDKHLSPSGVDHMQKQDREKEQKIFQYIQTACTVLKTGLTIWDHLT